MPTPQRLVPLVQQFDWGCRRLHDRMTGPAGDSGTGTAIEIVPMTDDEYLWEPVPGCWSIRRRAAGPGPAAAFLVGAGEWGRDFAPFPHPWPPPFTTLAWRLVHLSEMLTLRADHMAGSHALTRDDYRCHGDAAGGSRPSTPGRRPGGRSWSVPTTRCWTQRAAAPIPMAATQRIRSSRQPGG